MVALGIEYGAATDLGGVRVFADQVESCHASSPYIPFRVSGAMKVPILFFFCIRLPCTLSVKSPGSIKSLAV
jgi:hypothetical protein